MTTLGSVPPRWQTVGRSDEKNVELSIRVMTTLEKGDIMSIGEPTFKKQHILLFEASCKFIGGFLILRKIETFNFVSTYVVMVCILQCLILL